MKVTYNWLREYTDIDLSPEELAYRLTMTGLEVEGIEVRQRHFDHIFVGRVLEVRRHEQADQLSVCNVDVGEHRLEIVCGAPNVAAGQLVPVALEGAILAGGIKIAPREIRGVLSQGMICSEAELGISSRADTIMVLNTGLQPGVRVAEVLGSDDVVIELNVTPNRPDCLGVIGVAREAALFARAGLRKPAVRLDETGPDVSELASVEIVDVGRCPRYTARVVQEIRVEPSPWWLVQRLEAVGLRSINNIVDVTNYVMLETGQPLHAFDFDRIRGGKIVVQCAEDGERFVTLDEKAHTLDRETLMICDSERRVAIGGVMGGLDSEVCAETTNILLESAYFEPPGIRRTAKRLGIGSDASRRFERGTDPNGVDYALHRAAQLIQEIAGGRIARGFIDVYPDAIRSQQVPLRPGRINLLLGSTVPADEVSDILTRLEFEVEDGDPMMVTVPTFRPDVTREVDLIEEVARVHGYDKIPEKTRDRVELDQPINLLERGKELVRQRLVGLGFNEILTHSMMSSGLASLFRPSAEKVRLLNPLSEDLSTLRPSLIPGLLNVIQWNVNRKRPAQQLFEIGDVFWRADAQAAFSERMNLAGAITGEATRRSWASPKRLVDFYDLKGLVEAFLAHLSLPEVRFVEGRSDSTDDRSMRIVVGGDDVGFFGRLRRQLLQRWDLDQDVFAFELDLQEVLDRLRFDRAYQAIPRFPAVERDLSVVVEQGVQSGTLVESMRTSGGELLKSVELFDVYTGEQIPAGKISLSFSLRFLSNERTLTEEEVDKLMANIRSVLGEQFGATLR